MPSQTWSLVHVALWVAWGVCCVFWAVYCSLYFCSTISLEALISAWGLLSGLCSSKTFPKLPIPPKHLEGGFGSIRIGLVAKNELFLCCCCCLPVHCLWSSNLQFRIRCVPSLKKFIKLCVNSNCSWSTYLYMGRILSCNLNNKCLWVYFNAKYN